MIYADSVKQLVRPIKEGDDDWGMTGEIAIRLIYEAFDKAPTVIEADIENCEDSAEIKYGFELTNDDIRLAKQCTDFMDEYIRKRYK